MRIPNPYLCAKILLVSASTISDQNQNQRRRTCSPPTRDRRRDPLTGNPDHAPATSILPNPSSDDAAIGLHDTTVVPILIQDLISQTKETTPDEASPEPVSCTCCLLCFTIPAPNFFSSVLRLSLTVYPSPQISTYRKQGDLLSL
ncbi:hypothetical protein U1Q18_023770 [Sarracenia purpurea var. burkii]